MRYRAFGKSGLKVSEIGFGAWGIGGESHGATSYGSTDDAESVRALETAFDHGITFFDTAGAYGNGHSEELIGHTFAGRRDRIVIATKAGRRDFREPHDFSPSAVRASVESSLRRLRTDTIDLLQLHDPDVGAPELEDTFATLGQLRGHGSVRFVGVSVRSPVDGTRVLKRFDVDALQVNLNLLDQRAVESGLLNAAAAAGVAVIARTPLCFGFLTGEYGPETDFEAADHRNIWPEAQIARWVEGGREMSAAVDRRSTQRAVHVALRFCLSFESVATVIPGILTPAQARENAAASDFGPLSKAELARIRTHYQQNDYLVAPPTRVAAMEQD
jgi:aryl-alcohol dehydrogenase-like predicted oxidoreductase